MSTVLHRNHILKVVVNPHARSVPETPQIRCYNRFLHLPRNDFQARVFRLLTKVARYLLSPSLSR